MVVRLGSLIIGIILSGLAFGQECSLPRQESDTVKLAPQIRHSIKSQVKGVIPLEDLLPFIEKILIFDNKEQYLGAPYVVAQSEEHIEASPGDTLYVRCIGKKEDDYYTIFRCGQSYVHPVTGEYLGYQAIGVGSAKLKAPGDPAQFEVVNAESGIEIGARLLPSFTTALAGSFTLRAASTCAEGFILSAKDKSNYIGKNMPVVISLGLRDGLREGDILDIYQRNKAVVDPMDTGRKPCKIQLPDTRVGSLMVFQTYEKLSLALVVEAKEAIYLLDKVKSP